MYLIEILVVDKNMMIHLLVFLIGFLFFMPPVVVNMISLDLKKRIIVEINLSQLEILGGKKTIRQ